MKTSSMIAVSLAALISTSAFAQSTTNATQANQAKTRAEVIAELQAARASGEGSPGDTYGYDLAYKPFVSTKTRAQVKAELEQARANGELRSEGDTYGYDAGNSGFVSTKTRAQVKAELLDAKRSGQWQSQGDYTRG